MTTSASARLLIYVSGHLACIKIVGRANFTSSIEFKAVVNGLLEKEYTCFVLDLTDCVLMDSTFLGVLAGFGLRVSVPSNGQQVSRSIELLNPNPRIAELLENLGMIHLFKLATRDAIPVKECTLLAESAQPSRVEVKRNCLEAHRTLMDLDPANIDKFKDVARLPRRGPEKNQGRITWFRPSHFPPRKVSFRHAPF